MSGHSLVLKFWRLCFSACLLAVVLLSATPAAAVKHGDAGSEASLKKAPLRVVLFWSPTCGYCEDSKNALKAAAKKWGGRIQTESKDVSDLELLKVMLLYEDHYHSEEMHPPKVFVGESYIADDDKIGKGLDALITKELAKGSVTFVPKPEPQSSVFRDKFHSFRIGAICLGGLLDGINPCVFTTIIFLLSMLAYLGKTRRELAIVGVGFTLAVFLTYFLLGFAALKAIKIFSVNHGISRGLTYVVVALTFALAAWSFVDFVRYFRSGDVKKATLGLPKVVKSRIHNVIRTGLKTRGLLAGSFIIGVLVALLESLCTGQIYLPVLMIVAQDPELRSRAIGYLVLYNIMFILPLVVILVIAYFGVGSELMGRFLKKHLAAMKLALAILFAGLGVFLLVTM